jgi:hypothetical protein
VEGDNAADAGDYEEYGVGINYELGIMKLRIGLSGVKRAKALELIILFLFPGLKARDN